jgi:ubiquinone/menaquinone biosynthesis C-methylase UbiE
MIKGSSEVKKFYNSKGWVKNKEGIFYDSYLFGEKENSKIRQILNALRRKRICNILASFNKNLDLIECGCGGNPALFLVDMCASYTGVDFSVTGLKAADEKLVKIGLKYKLIESDICHLPFEDEIFDVAYSAHVLYHIPDENSQEAAFNEIMRVIKRGGVAIFVLANPRPLFFPVRLIKRLVADTPILEKLANKFGFKPVIPYKPMKLGWMKKILIIHGKVDVTCYAMASVWFNQNISEKKGVGLLVWKIIKWFECYHPKLAAYLGNYVIITIKKK